MSKFYKNKNFQIIIIIILVVSIFIGVYLTQKIQILMSRASDGFTLTDFIESFGSSEDEEKYNYELDINQDGKINVIDILFARAQDEAEEVTTDDEITDEEPTPTPFEEQYFTASQEPEPTDSPSESEE